jgi:hypothetical protein
VDIKGVTEGPSDIVELEWRASNWTTASAKNHAHKFAYVYPFAHFSFKSQHTQDLKYELMFIELVLMISILCEILFSVL